MGQHDDRRRRVDPAELRERLLGPRGDHLDGVREPLGRREPGARIDHVRPPAGVARERAQTTRRCRPRRTGSAAAAARRRRRTARRGARRRRSRAARRRPGPPRRRARARRASRCAPRRLRSASSRPGSRPPSASPRRRGHRRAAISANRPGSYAWTHTSISPPHGRPTSQASESAIPKWTSCGCSPCMHPLGDLDDRALDAAAGHAAGDLAVLVDGHLRARRARRRTLRRRPRWPARSITARGPVGDLGQNVVHQISSRMTASSSSEASELPASSSSVWGPLRASRGSAAQTRGARRAGSATRAGGRCAAAGPSPARAARAHLDPSRRTGSRPRRRDRRDGRGARLSSASAAPIRVPPEKSVTASAARSSARSWSRPPSSLVIRVSRVPNANASTRRRAATDACRYWSSIRAYGVIEPDTSHTSTTRPRPCARRPPVTVDRLAAGAQRGPHDPAQVGRVAAAPGRPRAARDARRAASRQPRDQLARDHHLGVGVLREVLVSEQLDVAVGGRHGQRVSGPPGSASGAARGTAARGGTGRSISPSSLVAGPVRSGCARRRTRPECLLEALEVVDGWSTARLRSASRASSRELGVDRRQRPVRGQQLADPDPRSLRSQRRGQDAEPVDHDVPVRARRRRRRPQTPSSTFRSRTRSTSSWTFSAAPSVSSRSASSPSASSAWAQTSVSPTPGSL